MNETAGPSDILVVYVTVPGDLAEKFGETLVRERLAACMTMLGGAVSLYWWEGAVQRAAECVCLFKTTKGLFPAFLERAKALHPYVVPCIVAWPLAEGSPGYCDWVRAETV